MRLLQRLIYSYVDAQEIIRKEKALEEAKKAKEDEILDDKVNPVIQFNRNRGTK